MKRLHAGLALFAACLWVAGASAGTLYGTRYPGWVLTNDTGNLQSWTQIGSLGGAWTNGGGGFAYDPATDTLYGVDDLSPPNLCTIDQSTGAMTVVGTTDIPFGNLRGLAFDTRNRVLYAASGGGEPSDLFVLDPATGRATHVAEIPNNPFPNGAAQFGGLAYDSLRDQLIWLQPTGDLATIDRSTAFAVLLYDLSPDNGSSMDGLTYDPDLDLIWAMDNGAQLYSYDPNNGYERTLRWSDCCYGMTALAYEGPAATSVPPVPDGHWVPGTQLLAGRNLADPSLVDVTWDTTACPAVDYNLYFGNLGDFHLVGGGVCDLGLTGVATVAIPGNETWWVIDGQDGIDVVGSHGRDSTGAERPLVNWDLTCAQTRLDLTGTCP